MWARTLLVGFLALASPDGGSGSSRSRPTCRTVKDCWLDEDGRAIRRPPSYRGRHLPKGDCGAHLRWLQNRLSCDDGACVAHPVADRC